MNAAMNIMNSVGSCLAPHARPPHDPLAMRLSARNGWRLADGLAEGVDVSDGSLRLALVTPAEPQLLDPAGAFGGVRPPAFAAFAADGALYLLDRAGRRLLWLDACACRFIPLPCLGRPGARLDPRLFDAPRALAVDATLLAVAGDDRVVVMGRRDLAPRLVLQRDWEPAALAFDRRGGLYVADRRHGAVMHFRADGAHAWTRATGPVHGLAVDRDGRLYLAAAAGAMLYEEGSAAAVPFTQDLLRERFPALPFRLDGRGRLVLGALCRRPCGDGVFGADGGALDEAAAPLQAAVYGCGGRALVGPLDSRIHACQWHRLAFEAALPPATRLRLRTRTDEVPWPLADIADATDPAWSAAQAWDAPGTPECLIVSPPGRFLWVEITLGGDGGATPALHALDIEFPRISLARYLPAAFREQPQAADLTDRLLGIFDQGFRGIEGRLDQLGYLFDARSAPAAMLGWLASWIGLAFPQGLSETQQRRLLRQMPRLYALRGTAEGLRQVLLMHLGLDLACAPDHPLPGKAGTCGPACPPPPRLILEHWRLRQWLFLDRGRLGDSARLWGESILNRSRAGLGMQAGVTQIKLERDPLRDPFHAHAHRFSVFLPAARGGNPAQRRRIEALVAREAPAHTRGEVHWVQPNMRLGIQCALGFDTVLGMPASDGPALGAARLGNDALPPRGAGPSGMPATSATCSRHP